MSGHLHPREWTVRNERRPGLAPGGRFQKKQAGLSARLFARILFNSYGFASPGPFGLNGSQFMIAGWI
jgi:hypothetical protein